jgi:hypothetical protein
MQALIDQLTVHEWGVVLFTLVSAVVAVTVVKSFRNSIISEISEAKEAVERENRKLLAEVSNNLSPRIVHCATEAAVSGEAARMISEVIESKRASDMDGTDRPEEDSSNDKKPETEEPPFVTFYGAADLARPASDDCRPEDWIQFREFDKALTQANEVGVRLRRHINLFTHGELQKRTAEAREQYLRWLCERYEYIMDNPRFEMVDNPRVPQWGASFSSVITPGAILEVKANGMSGIAIYHENISRNIRENLRQARSMANQDRVNVFRSNDPGSLNKLITIIRESAEAAEIELARVVQAGTHLGARLRNEGLLA